MERLIPIVWVLALALTIQADGGDQSIETDDDDAAIRLESGGRDQRLVRCYR
jgi:hypothetical protein